MLGCTYYSGAQEPGRCGEFHARWPMGEAKGCYEKGPGVAGRRPATMRVDLSHRGKIYCTVLYCKNIIFEYEVYSGVCMARTVTYSTFLR